MNVVITKAVGPHEVKIGDQVVADGPTGPFVVHAVGVELGPQGWVVYGRREGSTGGRRTIVTPGAGGKVRMAMGSTKEVQDLIVEAVAAEFPDVAIEFYNDAGERIGGDA